MGNIVEFMEEHIVPISLKMSKQRHLSAVRDGFSGMTGLIMISSLATLILSIPSGVVNEHIISICRTICGGTFSFMGLFACFGIANELWKSYKKDNLQGGFVSVAVLLCLSRNSIDLGTFSVTYLFTSIAVALITVEMLIKLENIKCLKVKLPEVIPSAVGKTLDSMIQPMVVIGSMALLGYILKEITGGLYLVDIITNIIQKPLEYIMNSVFGAIIIPLNNSIFWTLGIHGSQAINLLTNPILSVLSAENMILAQQGATEGYNIITGSFFMAFVWHGGSGATLGLLLSIIICGKKTRKKNKNMLDVSIWPGIFNINETVIFSAPIVLNPIFAIPFIVAPVINTIVAYFVISIGLVAPCIVQSVPWITPPILSGFLATGSLSGAILSGLTLVLSILIYTPFVILNNKIKNSDEVND